VDIGGDGRGSGRPGGGGHACCCFADAGPVRRGGVRELQQPERPAGRRDVYDPVLDKLIDDNRALAGRPARSTRRRPDLPVPGYGRHYVYVSGAAGADGLFDAKVADDAAPTAAAAWTFVLNWKPAAGESTT